MCSSFILGIFAHPLEKVYFRILWLNISYLLPNKEHSGKSIRKVLTQYKKEYQGDLKGEYLFDSQRSNQVTTRGAQHIVENYATRLNMPDLTCQAITPYLFTQSCLRLMFLFPL